MYSMVPKDSVVEPSSELSAILRNDLRGFELDLFPKELLKKNTGLDGTLVITHSKLYGPSDKTRGGQSKDGWQLIFIEACPLFMSLLSGYPESHRFEFCSTRIQIWGGDRVEEPPGRTNNRGGSRGSNNNNNNPTGPATGHHPRTATATGATRGGHKTATSRPPAGGNPWPSSK